MRILVLGAGGVGGYFAGRLAQAGTADVTFLVRPARKAQLDRDGLVIESPAAGNWQAKVQTVLAEDLRPGWDIVLLTAKAYDLESAIDAIRPAMDGKAAVLPLLNGLSHVDALKAAFGAGNVLGGVAQISATLAADGTVKHMTPLAALQFGELDGTMSGRVTALADAYAATPIKAAAVPDIMGAMWSKLVFLGTLAAATVLMRANIGEIAAAPGGADWVERLLERNIAVATANGHPPQPQMLASYRTTLRDGKTVTASMLRDLESGGRVEADHILGYLLEAARAAGVDSSVQEAAYIHAKAYEARRAAGRLPR